MSHDDPELIQEAWKAPDIPAITVTFTQNTEDVRLTLEVYEDLDGRLSIQTESYDASEIEWGSCDWNLTVDQARILRTLLDRWLEKQSQQPLSLNEQAHLLSAELGIMPGEALHRLQTEWQ